jgi:hypothetical protein
MEVVYRLRDDQARIDAMQRRSSESDEGLSTEHGLVGSDAWWRRIEEGSPPRFDVEGVIAKVYWGSMGDYPMFELRSPDGTTSQWAREGDLTRYARGAKSRVSYVLAPWKPRSAQAIGESASALVIEIAVEDIGARSSRIAPGPGGVGYQRHLIGLVRSGPQVLDQVLVSEHEDDRDALLKAAVEQVDGGYILAIKDGRFLSAEAFAEMIHARLVDGVVLQAKAADK